MIANKPKTYWDLYNVATYINTHKMNRKYNTTHQLENKLYSSVKKWATA
jgi:spore coat protein CotF